MSQYFKARRKRGACYGSLWKQHSSASTPPDLYTFKEEEGKNVLNDGSTRNNNINSRSSGSAKKNIIRVNSTAGVETLTAALEKNERAKCYEFCVLIGNTLTCYENLTAFRRGDHPSSEVRIVGASAWNPPAIKSSSNRRNRSSSPNHQLNQSTSPTNANTPPTFRLLTNAGTHIYCSAQTSSERDIWLAGLHSGLEITFAGFNETLTTLSYFSSEENSLTNTNSTATTSNNSSSSSTSTSTSTSTIHSTSKVLEPTILTPPIPKRSKTHMQTFMKRMTYSSTSSISVSSTATNNDTQKNPFLNPYETSTSPLSKTHCISCGKYPPEDTVKPYLGTPLTQYGLENVVSHVCQPCLIGQGVLRHVMSTTALYVSDAHERVALVKGLELMNVVLERMEDIEEEEKEKGKDLDSNMNGHAEEKENGEEDNNASMNIKILIEKQAKLDQEIMDLLHDPNFAACRRRSRTLDHISNQLSTGEIVAAEFIDKLNEYANDATTGGSNGSNNDSMNETMQMKKEALMVAGDMRAAIEMLHEHALPKKSSGTNYGIGTSALKGGTEMLSCVLEFFLDLCEQGELASVAFFWTQICQIHMQMLPPTDTESLIRIELVEDFLLTVCLNHSVHLGLELVWSCLADLEESIGAETVPSASCRRRRFAMFRFICELESLIFDMDGGWGGGSVCLRGMLSPSDQQASMIKSAMEVLQLHRRFSSHHLTRSARLDKLRLEAKENVSPNMTSEESVMFAAERKYQIARNAEYFSTQLMFCRRLGDIAERLRFMDVEERKDALKEDLEMFNASGRLGGDPLNNTCDASNGLVNVMYIPSNEGHVFRSKERTPVLLLMEIMSDQKIFETTPNSPKKNILTSQEEQSPTNTVMNGSNLSSSMLNEEYNALKCDTEENGKIVDLEEDKKRQEVDLLGLNENITTAQSSNSSQCCPSPKVLQSAKQTLDGQTGTKEVGHMVATMVHEQLKLAPIPDLTSPESNDSFLSCRSEQNIGDRNSEDSEIITSNGEINSPVAFVNETNTEINTDSVIEGEMEGKNIDPLKIQDSSSLHKDEHKKDLPESLEATSVDVLATDGTGNQLEDSTFNLMTTEDVVSFQQESNLSEKSSKTENMLVDLELSEDSVNDDAINRIDTATNEELLSPQQESNTVAEKAIIPDDKELNNSQAIDIQTNNDQLLAIPEETLSPSSDDVIDRSSAIVRKVSAFGSFKDFSNGSNGVASEIRANSNFGANGEGRRHVLNTIFVKGMRSSNLIARGVAPAARRAVQAMDRKRAQLLMNASNRGKNKDAPLEECVTSLNSLDISSMDECDQIDLMAKPSEEDECIEAIRLLLVQNRVALGKLSPEKAALALSKVALDMKRHGKVDDEGGDAGNIDNRLAGCGQTSSAILSAIRLWKDGMVSNGELLELIQKDLQFTQITLPGTDNETILMEDSAFWGRFAFGERWAEKKSRIQSSSTFGSQPGWDLTGVIVKSNDDLRQEAFAMQLIELSKEAFEIAGLELWIQPYRILATGRTTGIIEMVRNAMSFDALKKRPGYNEGGLLGHFRKMAEHAADPNEALLTAKRNFVRSLAAYSLLSYFFVFKDRHNGNLLLDTAGHVIHIDFGFIFGIAPGGSFSLESSVPFKITEEMIEVMDGLGSVLFSEFVTLFCCGFLALQAHAETFVTIVKITCEGSTFNCFEGKDLREIIFKLRERFCTDLNKEATIAFAMELIKQSTNALGTKQYDFFQYLSQGIAA